MEKNTVCHIRKNDKVKVISGKDKGKISKVLGVVRKKNRLLIENVNIVKRHTRPSTKNKQGGIVEGEAPIHWSNVMLMCSKCLAAVRIKVRKLEDGKKVRVCAKCDEIMDV
ncbi:MAG: 50S ribosomal protein L24 [Desulfobacteraceae bacterium]|jgi:large subunit ribosomal protein L24|nr:MAG: 50S ribosomal protein L24 [Desulfobacteraceae bacterium]